jgi:hypothetical protein
MSRRLVTMVVGIGAMAFALAGCFGNGPHPVGTGSGLVGPGLYRTLGDEPPGQCQITRYDASNTPFAYTNLTGGPLYIRLKDTDTTITSSGCKLWQAAFLVPPIFQTTTIGSAFVSGDYRVNFEVMPGTYTAPGSSNGHNCTFERVSDFTHDGNNVLDHQSYDSMHGGVSVTIQGTDFGFWSENCGTWTRTS